MPLSDIRTSMLIDVDQSPFHKRAQSVCLIFQDAHPELMADMARRVIACNAPSCGAYMMQMISC
jgi:hypothetical protein